MDPGCCHQSNLEQKASHIPVQHGGFFAFSFLILAVWVILFALGAVGVQRGIDISLLVLTGSFFAITASIYAIVTEMKLYRLYNYYAVIILYILFAIASLVVGCFMFKASEQVKDSEIISIPPYEYTFSMTKFRLNEESRRIAKTMCGLLIGNFILYVVYIVLIAIAIARHRDSGMDSRPSMLSKATCAPSNDIEASPQRAEMQQMDGSSSPNRQLFPSHKNVLEIPKPTAVHYTPGDPYHPLRCNPPNSAPIPLSRAASQSDGSGSIEHNLGEMGKRKAGQTGQDGGRSLSETNTPARQPTPETPTRKQGSRA